MEQLPEVLRIHVARLDFCYDDTCQISELVHLVISLDQVELSTSKAIAISYTWGEFDRRDVVVGHDAQGKIIHMNLGEEWDTQEFITRLVLLCIENGEDHGTDHSACWIDQLCIVQTNDEEVRKTLARIPSIYRTLDVVALMPGGICGCIQKLADVVRSVSHVRAFAVPMCETIACINSFGLCSYFDRVWTRQELLYSRSIRLVRTSDKEIHCAKSVADIHKLGPFAARLFKQYLNDHSEEHAWVLLHGQNTRFSDSSGVAIKEWMHIVDAKVQRFLKQLEFLLGQEIENQGQDDSRDKKNFQLDRFLLNLGRLGDSPRRATKARDYVASVWVDCPDYVLPRNYKTMGLPNLLQNAIHQLEENHGVSVPVTRYPGLFDNDSFMSVLWRPLMYLGRRPILSTNQVYNAIFEDHPPIPVTKSREVPIRVLAQPSTALSLLAKEYHVEFINQNATAAYQAVKPIINNWSNDVLKRVYVKLGEEAKDMLNCNFDELFFERLFVYGLVSNAGQSHGHRVLENRDVSATVNWNEPRLDHHRAIYRLVTWALNLDMRECQRSGLRLMVSPGRCIGLTRVRLQNETFFANPEPRTGSVITICTNRDSASSRVGNLLLEGSRRESYPMPKYEVTGIWVPHGYTSFFDAGAFFQIENHNALLC